MAGEDNRIQLTTPAPDGNAHPDTILKPQALRNWVDDLPYANPLGTTQAILSSLKLLNRHPSKVSHRTELMLIYLNPFIRIVDMARKLTYKLNTGQTPSRDTSQTVTAASAACSEMAYGFKHIVNTDVDNRKISPEEITQHIQLAMHCLSLSLMFEMSSYHAESRSTWREIFQLLMRAQQLGITSLEVTGDVIEADYEVSVINSFKSILLTSILDTTRLSPEETWASFDYLLRNAGNARILPIEQAANVSGNYMVPRDGSKKPVLFDPASPPEDPTRYMICETHKLNVQVNQHLEMLSDNDSAHIKGTDAISGDNKRQLLRQMLHIWHSNPKRRHERKEKFDRLSCAFGIGAVYHFLLEGSMRKTSSPTSMDDEVHDRDYLLSRPGEPKLSEGLHIYEFRQENLSASGVGIKSSDPEVGNLKIGQLVVIESKVSNPPSKLRVGVVRRLLKIDQNTREVGVQFLPGRQIPATVLPEIFGRKHQADLQPSMILELGENKPKAIITPHLIYSARRNYVLDVPGGETKRITAARLLESTSCFDCFEYSIIKLS